MEPDEIEKWTRDRFPEWEAFPRFHITVIDRAGSGRRFFRMHDEEGSGKSLLAMHYTLDRKENGRFVEITGFLERLGVPVPGILASDESLQVIWQEDLGKEDLTSFAGADWESVRAPLYRRALEAVLPLHRIRETSDDLPELEPPFDEALYQWEQDYFFDRFVAHFSAASQDEVDEIRGSVELASLVTELVEEPRRLLHRDFQSSNVMIRDGHPWLIDYQGLRWGVAEYDIASLLYDPYVELDASQRKELTRYYHGLRRKAGDEEPWESFEARFYRCAAQRLMQALGAYGFLGLEKGQQSFLAHIPAALDRLREVAVERGAAPGLAPVLSLRKSRVA